MRRLLAGNWKMHLYPAEAEALAEQLQRLWSTAERHRLPTVVFPPCLYLWKVAQILRGGPIAVGAQNGYPGEFGAFTGEVSMAQLAASGAEWVLIGHSERRQYFGEDGALLRKKLLSAQERGVHVIYCVGETLEHRNSQQTFQVLYHQLREVLSEGDIEWDRFVLAYEPVWAIGTGVNATPEQAQEVHSFLRGELDTFGAPADRVPILYGGSLKPENADLIFAQLDVDGGLVGGASLQADSFAAIADALLRSKSVYT
ncbi:MAG: triose-phosphate isomerase [Bacteroidia bacterium]|nr:triose-phosphate isomerase [Bacteroidia bacterium]